MAMQFRLVVTAIVWEFGFQKAMSQERRVAILLITMACISKQVHSNHSRSGLWSVHVVLLVQIFSGCLATVANEILLKRETQVSTNLQNVAQYVWTVFWALLIGVSCIPLRIERLSLKPLDFQEWVKMMDTRMLPSLVVLTLNGLIVSRVLR